MSIERQWYVKEYATEIHNFLREKEQSRFVYHGYSHLLPTRKAVVLWMLDIGDRHGFSNVVKHLAVYLFDMYMDNHHVGNHIKLLALGCLIVAVKVEEDTQTPSNSTFNMILRNRYKLSEFVDMELNILRFYNWEVLIPTAAHFIDYYSLFILSPTDMAGGELVFRSEKFKLSIERYMEYFQNMVLLDVIFYKFTPSLIAAACILTTRYCLEISPPWSVVLQNVTCYRYSHVKPCMDIMLRKLNTETVMHIAAQVQESSKETVNNSVYILQP